MSDLNENIKKLKKHLDIIKEQGVLNVVDGELKNSNSRKKFSNFSPVDETYICEVAQSNAEDIDEASSSSKDAFKEWSKTSPATRKKILYKIADKIVERSEEIALCETWDTGQAIRFMSKAAIRGSENFRYFADKAISAQDGLTLPSGSLLNITKRYPIGPVGIITPWNTPFMLSTWKVAPALAAGCTVVHKPAELSPVTAKILNEIALEAGLPPGVWNLVNGFGEEAGVALTKNKDIKAVAFVGESKTGSAIMRQGSETLKRVHFELGGKNPVIVFDDADLDRALDAVIFMIYSLNGERCTSSSRLLIQKNIAEEFISKLVDRVNKIKVGNPLDPNTEVGPLISENHLEKVVSYFDIAKREGAEIAVGGNAHKKPGWFVSPTLFKNAKPGMRISQEEIFGPVVSVIKFKDEADALRIANDTLYGLGAGVWTRNGNIAYRMGRAIQAGIVWTNCYHAYPAHSPFGGYKQSGVGRETHKMMLNHYRQNKNLHVSYAEKKLGFF